MHGARIAVIENEYGAVGIDDGLLQKNMKEKTEDDIIEMLNGCICCTVREVRGPCRRRVDDPACPCRHISCCLLDRT